MAHKYGDYNLELGPSDGPLQAIMHRDFNGVHESRKLTVQEMQDIVNENKWPDWFNKSQKTGASLGGETSIYSRLVGLKLSYQDAVKAGTSPRLIPIPPNIVTVGMVFKCGSQSYRDIDNEFRELLKHTRAEPSGNGKDGMWIDDVPIELDESLPANMIRLEVVSHVSEAA